MNEWQQLYYIDHEQNLLSKTNLDATHVSFLRLIVFRFSDSLFTNKGSLIDCTFIL